MSGMLAGLVMLGAAAAVARIGDAFNFQILVQEVNPGVFMATALRKDRRGAVRILGSSIAGSERELGKEVGILARDVADALRAGM